MSRIFMVDGITYPDPGPEVTPDQFKQMMAVFLPELATAEMTESKQDEDTVYHFRKRVCFREKEKTVLAYNLDWESCHKIADRTSYMAGIRYEDRKDFIQDVLVEMMKRARQNGGELSTKEMWGAAGCIRMRQWRAFKKTRGILSLDAPVRDTTIELSETIADDKAVDLDALLDAKSRLENLPPGIVCIGKKLIKENPLTKNQRLYLYLFQKGEVKPNRGMEIYHKRRSKGLCVHCGEESGNFSHCPKCQESYRVFQKKYRENKGQALLKTNRDYWRRQGRCPRCGANPEPGHKTCPTCLAKNRKYLQRHREKSAVAVLV